ncbi:MAG TPA: DNA polymerase [Pyrinomonadaceae bacterium]|nr:DNA polymerase [Pyrinomonadaceae bacterium]
MIAERRAEVRFEYITTPDSLERAVKELSAQKEVGFDTETTELDPRNGQLRLVQFATSRSAYLIDLFSFDRQDRASLKPLIDFLESPQTLKIAHNAKFDLKWIRHHLGCEVNAIFDTYLASLLISAGEGERRHSLADIAQFFLNIELDKSEQVSDWAAAELSDSQLSYAARDALVMPELAEKIREVLVSEGLTDTARIEFECLMPIADMELNGIYLDKELWLQQIERIKHRRDLLAAELQEQLSAGVAQRGLFGFSEINLDSQPQLIEALTNLGIPIGSSTSSDALLPLAAKYPIIEKLIDFRHAQKRLSGFGENFLEFIHPASGRIHADFRQIGAPSGRFSCSNPNLQQIPAENAYRQCFRAPEGKKFVIADYSQIELRILAELSADEGFINAFESGIDFHSATASMVFKVPNESITPQQRSFAKRLNFGIVYGIGAERFGRMTGISNSQAESVMRRYFSSFPQMDSYLRETGNRVIEERSARTLGGRLIRLNFDPQSRESIGAARRYGVNSIIQGTAADILKIALRKIQDSLSQNSGKLVNIVHDEIIIECDDSQAEETAQILRNSMLSAGKAFLERVPLDVELRITDNWAKSGS